MVSVVFCLICIEVWTEKRKFWTGKLFTA